jgi:hypothetical protein
MFRDTRAVLVLGRRATDMTDRPSCKLVGTDGNVFSIIGRVKKALRDAGQADRASEFVEKAFAAKSYDEVLRLAMDFVEVE